MNRFFCFVFFLQLLANFQTIKANEVRIKGKATDFAGQEIRFFIYGTAFLDIEQEIFTADVSDEGYFADTININQTTCLYAEAGPYLTYFFIEPDKYYEIIFPEIKDLSPEWKYNPYFERKKLHLKIKETGSIVSEQTNKTEINSIIRDFNKSFDPFLDKQLLYYYAPEFSKAMRDSFISVVYEKTISGHNSYLDNYTEYKKAILEFSVSDHNLDTLVSEYIVGKRINFHNPAYRNLFNLLLNDYFTHLNNKDKYENILRTFAGLSYENIRKKVKDAPALSNDTIFNLVLLHEIYKAYYSGDFDRQALIEFLERSSEYFISEPSRLLFNEIHSKFTGLRTGYPAPKFTLTDIYGDTVSLGSLEGQYVYLGFCNTASPECMGEMEVLKYLHSKHKEYLTIITILSSPPNTEMSLEKLAEINSWKWIITAYEEAGKIIEQYDIKTFPQFYLLGPEGKMIMSPAMNPSRGFEQNLFRIMRSRGDI